MDMCVCHSTYVEVREQLVGFGSLSHYVSSHVGTQVVRLDGKYLYFLSSLGSPHIYVPNVYN